MLPLSVTRPLTPLAIHLNLAKNHKLVWCWVLFSYPPSRACPAGRRKSPTHITRFGPYGSGPEQNCDHGLVGMSSAPNGSTHPVHRWEDFDAPPLFLACSCLAVRNKRRGQQWWIFSILPTTTMHGLCLPAIGNCSHGRKTQGSSWLWTSRRS
jgi:hypothetical protein